MSSKSMVQCGGRLAKFAAIVLLSMFASFAAAQDSPDPKWEIFGGYSFFHPGADIHGTLPGALFPLSSRIEPNPRGFGASYTYNFNRWFGLTLDSSYAWQSGEKTTFAQLDDAGLFNLSIGPKITLRRRHFAPFLEALVGDHYLTPEAFHDVHAFGLMLGGGLDVPLSRHVGLRVLRADYVMSNYKFGLGTVPSTNIRG